MEEFEQIGCIHTCQGLEFDYIGVIIGDDLRYEDGQIITDYTKRAEDDYTTNAKARDNYLRTHSNNLQQLAYELDRIIRNTYRILLTRGMKGCRVYCTDSELANYLEMRIRFLKGTE